MSTRNLFPHQKDFLSEVAGKRRKLALFWEMRLGKSLAIIEWVKSFSPVPTRVLIICPKPTIISWLEEFEKEKILQPFVFTSKNKHFHHLLPNGWVITNYECLTARDSVIPKLPWDAIVLDESSKIKEPTTVISKLLTNINTFPFSVDDCSKNGFDYHFKDTPFASNSKNLYNRTGRELQLRAILTGTPAPESYLNYFTQFKFLFGKLGQYRNYYQFRHDNFKLSDERNSHRYIAKYHFLSGMAKYLDKHAHTLTRKKLDVELPHVHEKRFVQMAPEHAKLYKDFEKDWFIKFATEAVEGGLLKEKSPAQLITKFAIVAQNYLHQLAIGYPKQAPDIAGNHKLKELITLLEGELLKEKVVIWCRYTRDIDIIYETLHKLKFRRLPLKFYRAMDQKQCTETIRRFNLVPSTATGQTKACDTLICQLAKGSMGMDFSAADTQIFFSRSWSATQNIQARDRLIHLQKRYKKDFSNILTIDILTEDTIDIDLFNALMEKRADANVFKFFLQRTGFSI